MKKAFLLLLMISSFFANGQSLKEALFSGKLKNEPGTVIRKGDNLSTKIDTSTRRPVVEETVKTNSTAPAVDASAKTQTPQTQTVTSTTVATTTESKENTAAAPPETEEVVNEPKEVADKPKDNNAIWKDFMTTLTGTLKSEVLSSKKIKKGDYYVLVSYSIGTDGQTSITDVFVSPENAFLQQSIKERLALEAPKLIPVLNDAGQPRKVNKKYNFTLVKE